MPVTIYTATLLMTKYMPVFDSFFIMFHHVAPLYQQCLCMLYKTHFSICTWAILYLHPALVYKFNVGRESVPPNTQLSAVVINIGMMYLHALPMLYFTIILIHYMPFRNTLSSVPMLYPCLTMPLMVTR